MVTESVVSIEPYFSQLCCWPHQNFTQAGYSVARWTKRLSWRHRTPQLMDSVEKWLTCACSQGSSFCWCGINSSSPSHLNLAQREHELLELTCLRVVAVCSPSWLSSHPLLCLTLSPYCSRHTHKHPHTCVNEHIVPGPMSTSGALAVIDALTWQSCQWKWQIHFAGFVHRLPTKNKNPRLCHHYITTCRLPPDWLLPSRPVPVHRDTVPGLSLATSRQTWQPAPYLCVVFKRSRWALSCPECSVFLDDRGASQLLGFDKND